MTIFRNIPTATKTNPLKYAEALQTACSEVGFDWPNAVPVYNKVIEELDEIKEASANPLKSQADVAEEMGDLLFACINLSRHLGVSPSECLVQANKKFAARFNLIEKNVTNSGKDLNQICANEYESLWLDAKKEISSL